MITCEKFVANHVLHFPKLKYTIEIILNRRPQNYILHFNVECN